MTLHAHLGTADPTRCGCERDVTGDLMPVDEALARALDLVRPVAQTERLAPADATGRVLAGPVLADRPLPPFDTSAMDGLALRSSDLEGEGPWELPLAGGIRMGGAPVPLPPGTALRVAAGAALPRGADAVVPWEQAMAGDGSARIGYRPRPGAGIRPAGSDLSPGEEILPAGRVVGPREAGALAAAGLAQVEVRRRLEVAILSIGSGLVAPEDSLATGKARSPNGFALAAQLSVPWIGLHELGALPDDPALLRRALVEAAGRADLVVTAGGLSAGDEGLLPRLVREAGGTVHVSSVAMKPGRPLTIGRIGGTPWIGLPGDQVAAFVGWTVLGARMAEAMAGIAGGGPRKTVVRLGRAAAHQPGRCEFRLARLLGYDAHGAQVAELLPAGASHRVSLLPQADGLALIPAEAEAVAAGTLVEFLPF